VDYAGIHASVSPGKTFLYRYDWASTAQGGAYGAIHAIDVPGAFQTYELMAPILGDVSAARVAGDAFHGAIVSFAKSGAPTVPAPWPAYETATKPCMIFDDPCALRHDIDRALEAIW
jgi:para-nitrobenzyl esterase